MRSGAKISPAVSVTNEATQASLFMFQPQYEGQNIYALGARLGGAAAYVGLGPFADPKRRFVAHVFDGPRPALLNLSSSHFLHLDTTPDTVSWDADRIDWPERPGVVFMVEGVAFMGVLHYQNQAMPGLFYLNLSSGEASERLPAGPVAVLRRWEIRDECGGAVLDFKLENHNAKEA